jgi:hypothetical protein
LLIEAAQGFSSRRTLSTPHRTRVFVEAYIEYSADVKPAENEGQRKNNHLGKESY